MLVQELNPRLSYHWYWCSVLIPAVILKLIFMDSTRCRYKEAWEFKVSYLYLPTFFAQRHEIFILGVQGFSKKHSIIQRYPNMSEGLQRHSKISEDVLNTLEVLEKMVMFQCLSFKNQLFQGTSRQFLSLHGRLFCGTYNELQKYVRHCMSFGL